MADVCTPDGEGDTKRSFTEPTCLESISESDRKKAEELKEQANELFKSNFLIFSCKQQSMFLSVNISYLCRVGIYMKKSFPSEIYLRGHMPLLTHILGDIYGNFRG